MIEQIKVTDLGGAKNIARQTPKTDSFTAWITAVDPEDNDDAYNIARWFGYQEVPVLTQFFRDFDDNDDEVEEHGPHTSHIKDIVKFFTGLHLQDKSHRVGVNCYAGRSRSTAIAMIGWMVAKYCPEVALHKVLHVRPFAFPNERILRLYDEIANTDSQRVVADWKHNTWKENKAGIMINPAWNS